jgi:HEAT repeat protein
MRDARKQASARLWNRLIRTPMRSAAAAGQAQARQMRFEMLVSLLVTMGLVVASLQEAPSLDTFAVSDVPGKQRMLYDIAASRSRVSVENVVVLIQAGVRDPSEDVRVAALAAVAGRVMASRWAGTAGPGLGPASPVAPTGERRTIPVEWRDDQQKLREAVYDDCVSLLRSDQNRAVRHQALLALGSLEWPLGHTDAYGDAFVQLLLDVFRNDPDARIRAEVVKTFRLIPNESDPVRLVLRDALVDPEDVVRYEGLNAITPQVVGGRPKLLFDDARATVLRALEDDRPGVRLGAVRALNVFGAPAREYVPLLERMQQVDPDAQVRQSATLAIDAIRRADP